MISGIAWFVVVGFFAQMVDGALGMAYGVSATTVLLSMGVPPKFASASVHGAEIVTTGVSGLSHWAVGNVHFDLAKKLVLPGVIGAVIGAYVLSSLDGDIIKPWISLYLGVMGIVIIWKAFSHTEASHVRTWLGPIGFVGGFADAIGGGGWGPIVTTTLVARGNSPRYTVGSVNLTEFFVTVAQSAVFVAMLRSQYLAYWQALLGLLIGGAIAAPMAAMVTRHLPRRPFMVLVGLLITGLSIRTLVLTMLR
jgi:uncharacterized protein